MRKLSNELSRQKLFDFISNGFKNTNEVVIPIKLSKEEEKQKKLKIKQEQKNRELFKFAESMLCSIPIERRTAEAKSRLLKVKKDSKYGLAYRIYLDFKAKS